MTLFPIKSVKIENFLGISEVTVRLGDFSRSGEYFIAVPDIRILEALAIGLGAVASRMPHTKGRSIRLSDSSGGFTRVTVEGSGTSWEVHKGKPDSKGVGVRSLHKVLDPVILKALDGDDATPLPLVAYYRGGRSSLGDSPFKYGPLDRFSSLDKSLKAGKIFCDLFAWFLASEAEEHQERATQRSWEYRLPMLEGVRQALAHSGLGYRNPRTDRTQMFVDDLEGNPLRVSDLPEGVRSYMFLVLDVARRMMTLNPSTAPEHGLNSEAVVMVHELRGSGNLQIDVEQGLRRAFPRAQFVVTS